MYPFTTVTFWDILLLLPFILDLCTNKWEQESDRLFVWFSTFVQLKFAVDRGSEE